MSNILPATVFASLSNETRLRCLYLAATHQEVCVCEVVDALGITQPTASKSLAALKAAGIVTDRRDANWSYYRLNERMPAWLATIVQSTVASLAGTRPYVADEKRYRRSRVREAAAC